MKLTTSISGIVSFLATFGLAVTLALSSFGCDDVTCENSCDELYQQEACEECADGLTRENDCVEIYCE